LEQYFSGSDDNTSDYVMEGLLKSLIHSSLIAVENPEDYEARSNIMWIATWALNTFVAKGKSTDWMVHMIGQQVGAYTNATHGMTLAAVSMPYYRFIMKDGLAKFKRYAINVWNVNSDGKTEEQVAEEGLIAMEEYMNKLGLVMKISELGVTEDMLSDIAKSSFVLPGGYRVLTTEEIEEILKNCM
jgi:alcohol dehydrogenase YqhD (iron-dependent ADH family)